MYGVYAKSINSIFLFIIWVVLMSPASSWESVPKAITLFPARTQSKWPVWCTSVLNISARAAGICFLSGFTGLQLLVVLHHWVWAAF